MFKKQVPNDPYGAAPANPAFRQEVFGSQNHSQVEDLGGSKLGECQVNSDAIFRIITLVVGHKHTHTHNRSSHRTHESILTEKKIAFCTLMLPKNPCTPKIMPRYQAGESIRQVSQIYIDGCIDDHRVSFVS